MANAIVVLGSHRSGTSLVTGVLAQLGASTPKNLMPPTAANERGYFESEPIHKLNDQILASAGSSWDDWREFNPNWGKSEAAVTFRQRASQLFREEFDHAPLPILKDPRICRLAPFWLDVFRGHDLSPTIVMPIRTPIDTAKSLQKRDRFSIGKGLLIWLRHVLDAEAFSRSENRTLFFFDDFRENWRKICGGIAENAQIAWPRQSDRSKLQIEQLISSDLVHHQTSESALRADPRIHPWILETYTALGELRRNPQSNSALATLDDIRASLNDAGEIFGRLVVEYEIANEDLRLREVKSVAASEHPVAKELERALAEAKAAADTKSRALDESRRDHEATTKTLAALQDELRLARNRTAELERFAAEAARDSDALIRTLAESCSAADAARQALAAALAERDDLRTQLEALEGELNRPVHRAG